MFLMHQRTTARKIAMLACCSALGLVIVGGNAITNDGMRFIGNGIDNYTGGQGWRISGSGANNFNELRDLAFVVTGTPVPEPSTMCLAAGFGLFGVIGMHRRNRIRR